ncbi:MAG: hypothetical protein EOP84_03695 [Verrucomicrobiaceae bacterium]|nr:MAG: hypothetical protein EOP84_03695 [Verrucomicrobiaceae bacterium]
MLNALRIWCLRRRYRVGKTISQFVAKDVRREVDVLDTRRLDEGFITARVRTTNILYQMSGLVAESEFEQAREIAIVDLWLWTGKSWGGLPDGTSLVGTHMLTKPKV